MSATSSSPLELLIVEDGDEYLENLSRFIDGVRFTQAHHARSAIDCLNQQSIDVIYLDMRFDRIPGDELVGDYQEVLKRYQGDHDRARRHLQNNQGLYILSEFERAGYDKVPTVLAYDFRREKKRLEILKRQHPQLHWVPDTIAAVDIRELLFSLRPG
ncbi:MAG: hypothetical protein AAF219_02915 [Myxococcota bacterium]